MSKRKGRKAPLRRIDAHGADASIIGSYVQYDGHFDMTITLFGKQHTRQFTGQLSDYEQFIPQLPGKIAVLREVARELGDTHEAERFTQLLRELPRMSLAEQALKVVELVVALVVLQERLERSGLTSMS